MTAPIVYELWDAFVEERKCWEIAEANDTFIATDRPRYISGAEHSNPMDVMFTSEVFVTRGQAAYFIGIQSMSAALNKVGIIHADA